MRLGIDQPPPFFFFFFSMGRGSREGTKERDGRKKKVKALLIPGTKVGPISTKKREEKSVCPRWGRGRAAGEGGGHVHRQLLTCVTLDDTQCDGQTF